MSTELHHISSSGGASISLSLQSPSFSTYSSENIADIAARVVKELNLSQNDPFDDDFYSSFTLNDAFRHPQPPILQNDTGKAQNDDDHVVDDEFYSSITLNNAMRESTQNDDEEDEFYASVTLNDAYLQQSPKNDTVKAQNDDEKDDDEEFYSCVTINASFRQQQPQNDTVEAQNDDEEYKQGKHTESDSDDEESEFEFAILTGEENASPISADEIFDNGQIKPMFPIFNTDLIYRNYNQNAVVSSPSHSQTIRLPLRKLLEERESTSVQNGVASSSSSEADELEGVPPGTYCVWTPKKKEEIMMRKKSKSTGSSKRWRFKDLLYTRSNSDGKDTFVFLTPNHKSIGVGGNGGGGNGGDGKRRERMVTIGKKKVGDGGGGWGEGGKKKSYLPYRQDLVGFFANVNGISRTVRPF